MDKGKINKSSAYLEAALRLLCDAYRIVESELPPQYAEELQGAFTPILKTKKALSQVVRGHNGQA